MTDFETNIGMFHGSAVAVDAAFRVEEVNGRWWVVRTLQGVDKWVQDFPTGGAANTVMGQMLRRNATARRNSRAKPNAPKKARYRLE